MDRNNMRSSYVNSGTRSLPHMGKRHHSNGHSARLSPPAHTPQHTSANQHEDLINYIYDSWNQVARELERGGDDAKYYQEVQAPRQIANFRPFDFQEWWGRRFMQNVNRNKQRS